MKYRKILFISPEYNYPDKESYPSGGLLSMASVLKEKGCDVHIVHMASDKKDLLFIRKLLETYKPDLVGISIMTFQVACARKLVELVKDSSDSLCVIGGPHVSALKQAVFIDFPKADIAVLGEGEETIAEIVQGKELSEIKGICTQDMVTTPRGRIKNLDSLPYPDLDFIDLKNFSAPAPVAARPSMSIMASRGCPSKCSFCSRSVFGNQVSFKSPERVVNEIQLLSEKWGIKEVFIHDDTLNLKRDWCMEIFELIIKRGLNTLKYKCPFRANEKLVDIELLDLAKRAGVWLIFYGVESGNQEMLDRMHKNLTKDEIRRAFRLTHEAGIQTTASFIVGHPGETLQTIKETRKFAEELKPFWLGFSRLTPFPGTEVGNLLYGSEAFISEDVKGGYDNCKPDHIYAPTKALDMSRLEYFAEQLDRWSYKYKLMQLIKHPVIAWNTLRNR